MAGWLVATVIETVPETVRTVTLRLDVPDWPGHVAGQHVDLRLTAEDGYRAQRSYSIASAPGAGGDGDRIDLTVVRLDDGEVSPYLTIDVEAGDQIEIRGPVGGFFTWDPGDPRPTLLVGGGAGVVPLMAMLRHHEALAHTSPMHLVYSSRTADDVLYRDELAALAAGTRTVTVTLTRADVAPAPYRRGRVDRELLDATARAGGGARVYVCGPTPFVEAVADHLVDLGHDPALVRTERFGPTGD